MEVWKTIRLGGGVLLITGRCETGQSILQEHKPLNLLLMSIRSTGQFIVKKGTPLKATSPPSQPTVSDSATYLLRTARLQLLK